MLADDAFGMSTRLLKPYPNSSLDPAQRIYNYRHSRARRSVESAFGIMTSKFRLLRRPLDLSYEHNVSCTKAITVLHNHLLQTDLSHAGRDVDEDSGLIPCGMESISTGRRYNAKSASARKMRDDMANYFFSGKGQVDFQWSKVFST